MAKFQESMPPFDTNKTDFFGEKLQLKPMDSVHTVSYTHLTLPTNREV